MDRGFLFSLNSCIILHMKSTRLFVLLSILWVLVVIVIGSTSILILTNRIDRAQRDMLLVQAKQAALLVSSQDIASLSGKKEDLSNPVYQRLKTQFTLFREANPQIRFAYVMGYDHGIRAQFFYVDSEPTNSSDYSPPGQLFGDTREEDIQRYLAGEPYTDGPYRDSWGEWISGYAPIKNEQGTVVGIVGVDVATSVWHAQIKFARIMIITILVLLVIIVIAARRAYYRRLRSIGVLAKRTQQLEQQQVILKHMQQLAQLGTFTIHFPEGEIAVDEQFMPLFKNTRMAKNFFLTYVHVEDQEKFETMLKEIASSNIVYSWVDLRIGTQEAGFRKYHIYGNIERHASGSAGKFDGAIQDITDIKS
jgi:sensor histidine kinase regulating citrate/malate metabolism